MRSNRSCRDSLSYKKTVNELRTNKVKQFAPEVVEVFLDILEKN